MADDDIIELPASSDADAQAVTRLLSRGLSAAAAIERKVDAVSQALAALTGAIDDIRKLVDRLASSPPPQPDPDLPPSESPPVDDPPVDPLADPPPPSDTPQVLTIAQGELWGGGYFMRFAFSPDGKAKYVTYDSGQTGYRLNAAGDRWDNVNNAALNPPGLDTWNVGLGRVNEFAVAPSNSAVAVALAGPKLFKTVDGLTTRWLDSGLTIASDILPRGHGPVCAFDPLNDQVAFLINADGKVCRTEDQFATLPVAAGAPSTKTTTGGAVAFDPTSGSTTVNGQVVTAGVYLGFAAGIFESRDGGVTFTPLAGGPPGVQQFSMSPDGVLYMTGTDEATHKNVWRYVTATSATKLPKGWKNLPAESGSSFRSVAHDPLTPGRIVALMGSGNINLSSDYGETMPYIGQPGYTRAPVDTAWLQTWKGGVPNVGTADQSMSNGSCMFDPVVPGLLWICDGVGVWQWDAAKPKDLTVRSLSRGLGGLIVDQAVKMPDGPLLLSVQDRVAFIIADPAVAPVGDIGILEQFAGGNAAAVLNGWGIDYAKDGSGYIMVAVDGGVYGGVVQTGGLANAKRLNATVGWQSMLACQTADNFVVGQPGLNFQYSLDGGKTIGQSLFNGLKMAGGWGGYYHNYNGVVASDTEPLTYYALNRGFDGAVGIDSVVNPGSGHAVGDVITLKFGDNPYAKIKVSRVNAAGGIVGAVIDDPGVTFGAVYPNPAVQIATTGKGTGASLNLRIAKIGGLWKSTDGGANWTQASVGPITANGVTMHVSVNAQLKKYRGAPYLLFGNGIAYNYGDFPAVIGHDVAGAVTWSAIAGIKKAWLIDAGAPAPGYAHRSLVFFGYCATDPDPSLAGGFIAADFDPAQPTKMPTWRRLFSTPNGITDAPRTLCCDPNIYGRAYWGYDATGFGYMELR